MVIFPSSLGVGTKNTLGALTLPLTFSLKISVLLRFNEGFLFLFRRVFDTNEPPLRWLEEYGNKESLEEE
jgi:hypothetical protein